MNLIIRGGTILLAVLLTACAGEEDSNFAPNVSAGTDKIVTGGQIVVVSATAEDTDGTIATYRWTQTRGTAVTIIDSDEDSMRFEAPILDAAETLEFKVTVTDNQNAVATDTMAVLVNEGIETPQNLRVRMPPDRLTAVVQWDAVTKADSYFVYYAYETFSGLTTIDNYVVLEEATQKLVPAVIEGEPLFLQIPLTRGQRYFFTVTAAFTPTGGSQILQSVPASDVSRLGGATFTVSKPLNDTTVSQCLDADSAWMDCQVEELPGQDGELGRTAQRLADTLDKTGSGIAGYDFTPLDVDGEESSFGNPDIECIRDNVTGLIWELKKPADFMRRGRNEYSWYEPDTDKNGGDAGLEVGPECGGGVCSTYAYVARLNQAGLCGQTHWSVPSVQQMRSIGDIALACNLDGSGCRYKTESYYWTSITHAPDTSKAMRVTLDGRTDIPMPKAETARFIAVAAPVSATTEETVDE